MSIADHILWIGTLVCALAPSSLARPEPPRTFSEISRRADHARESGQIEQAIPLYRAALRQRPSWHQGWWNLGASLYELQRFAEAQQAFRTSTKLRPANSAGWAFIGMCEYQLGKYESSLRHFLKADQLGIDDNRELASLVRYHAALLLNRTGNFEQALNELFGLVDDGSPEMAEVMGINALRIAALPTEVPDKRELITKAGQAAWASYMGNLNEAKKKFEELVTNFPNEPGVHYAYGVYLLEGDPDQALQQFQRELAISPSHVFTRLQMVFLYLKQGTPDKAMDLAEQAVKLKPDFFLTHNVFGRVLLEGGQSDRAIQELLLAVRLEPRSPENHRLLAEAYRDNGKPQAAAREMKLFEKLDRQQKRGYTKQAPR